VLRVPASAAERYDDGVAFKAVARDANGVIVTILSDNYFGYCKKEVKSYISYSANLFGLCEEEHAGGALLFTREQVMDSGWYAERLRARQAVATRQWRSQPGYLERFLTKPNYASEAARLGIPVRLEAGRREYARVSSEHHREELRGTLGAEPAIVAPPP
jgi:hypothetical protein